MKQNSYLCVQFNEKRSFKPSFFLMKKHLSLLDALNSQEFSDAMMHLREFGKSIKKFVISLSAEDRTGIRTIAEGREGYAREMLRVARLYINSLPREYDVEEFVELFRLYDEWKPILTEAEMYCEQVDDTLVAIGMEIMKNADTANGYLQIARKGNANLDRALAGIDNFNSRYGKSSDSSTTTNTPPIAADDETV